MSTLRLTTGLLIFSFLCIGFGSIANDLASPDQKMRDAAAKVLQASWVPPARTNWDSFLAAIKDGTPRTNILNMLWAIKATPEGQGASGGGMTERYRLDDLWNLECYYKEGGEYPLIGKTLVEQVRSVWVLPPTNFSGI